jgi:hypothetical protein
MQPTVADKTTGIFTVTGFNNNYLKYVNYVTSTKNKTQFYCDGTLITYTWIDITHNKLYLT